MMNDVQRNYVYVGVKSILVEETIVEEGAVALQRFYFLYGCRCEELAISFLPLTIAGTDASIPRKTMSITLPNRSFCAPVKPGYLVMGSLRGRVPGPYKARRWRMTADTCARPAGESNSRKKPCT